MRSAASLSLLLALLLGASGCAYYHLRSPEPTPATEYRGETLHAFFWGAIEEERIADNCVSNAIDEVRVRNNYGYALITVLTLGIWMPLDIEWRCAKRPLDDGEI